MISGAALSEKEPVEVSVASLERENKRLKREVARLEALISRSKAATHANLDLKVELQTEQVRKGKDHSQDKAWEIALPFYPKNKI